MRRLCKEAKGSFTIYASLSCMFLVAIIVTFFGMAREYQMQSILQMNSDVITESIFADYERPLWKDYHILGARVDCIEGEIDFKEQEIAAQSYSRAALHPIPTFISDAWSLYCASLKNTDFVHYRLLTDQEGQVFTRMAAGVMARKYGVEELWSVEEKTKEFPELLKGCEEGETYYQKACEVLENLTNEKGEDVSVSVEDTPVGDRVSCEEAGFLGLVVENPQTLSHKAVELENAPSHRQYAVGKSLTSAIEPVYEVDNQCLDSLLMRLYCKEHFQGYEYDSTMETDQNQILDYELEYLIHGFDTDQENLKGAVKELFVIREMANYGYLQTDTAKMAQAYGIATTLGAASGNPLVVEAIKQGILIAWASAEALLDVRGLLAGKKIPMWKTSDTWTSDLSCIGQYKTSFVTAKESEMGLTYEQYLVGLLYTKSDKVISERALDLIEGNIRLQEGYEEFCVDHIMVEAQIQYTYEYPGILSGLSLIETDHSGKKVIGNQGYFYMQ